MGPSGKTRLYLMFGNEYPPYSMWNTTKGQPDSISGIGVDVAKEVCKQCDLDCVFVVDQWGNCWDDVKPGEGLMNGWYDGCVTYTNQYQRQWSLEFSHSFLKKNKPAGLLARLDENGRPVISPQSDLSGHKICDVRAWAPTIKTLAYSKNDCDDAKIFQGYEVVIPDEDGPDASMQYLLDGKCDAVYMYADMVESRKPEACNGCRWDAELYNHLGSKYAWIHTGVMEHMPNGTTLTLSKKGSGVPALVNPCIEKTLKTKAYYEACEKYGLVSECYPNEFFPEDIEYHPYVLDNEDRSKECAAGTNSAGIDSHCGCAQGYCNCKS